MSESKLAEALAAFQAELPEVIKAERAEVEGVSKSGKPFKYSYMYADLAAVSAAALPLLGKHGLSFSTRPTLTRDGFRLIYKLRHTSGEYDGGQYPLPDPTRVTPQELGSAITYARRYCLCSITGIAPKDDDDAAAASAGEVIVERVPAPRDERHATEPDEGAQLNYETALADAATVEQVNKIGGWIAGDKRLTLAQRNVLHQQFDARMTALTEQEQPTAAEAELGLSGA